MSQSQTTKKMAVDDVSFTSKSGDFQRLLKYVSMKGSYSEDERTTTKDTLFKNAVISTKKVGDKISFIILSFGTHNSVVLEYRGAIPGNCEGEGWFVIDDIDEIIRRHGTMGPENQVKYTFKDIGKGMSKMNMENLTTGLKSYILIKDSLSDTKNPPHYVDYWRNESMVDNLKMINGSRVEHVEKARISEWKEDQEIFYYTLEPTVEKMEKYSGLKESKVGFVITPATLSMIFKQCDLMKFYIVPIGIGSDEFGKYVAIRSVDVNSGFEKVYRSPEVAFIGEGNAISSYGHGLDSLSKLPSSTVMCCVFGNDTVMHVTGKIDDDNIFYMIIMPKIDTVEEDNVGDGGSEDVAEELVEDDEGEESPVEEEF